MRDVYELVEAVAPQDCNVVIEGENGTGKEIVADEIHVRSPRKGGPLVKMSCSTFVETLLEDELFGHEKGAFTDARDLKIGRFERANNGTIFIDDIDDMPLHTQVKLLRVLQEREFERLGGTRTVKINIRVICATKVDLGKAVREGKFREDLFFRLNVVTLKLPALRERDGDIPILLAHFMQKYGKGEKYELKPQTLAGLENYRWPGNVRELEHSVERAIVLAGNSHELKKEHLLKISPEESPEQLMKVDLRALRGVVAESEARHIRAVLEHTKGHKGEAAEILGISRKNLWEKMKEYGLE